MFNKLATIPRHAQRLFEAATLALLCLAAPAHAAVGTVLLVVPNASSLSSQESAKKTLFESWGYTVTAISATDTAANFTSSALASSVVYVSETVLSGDVGTKLTATPVGVICEEAALSDELGIASSFSSFTSSQISITSASHYITSTLGTGTKTFASVAQPVRALSGTLSPYTLLGQQFGTTNASLVVMERGDTLYSGGTAAGRRVYLPFGNTGFNINDLSADGLTILQRSIEWCMRPVAHWKLDDASGSTVTDSVGGYNGTRSGTTWTSGRLAGALRFNGSTDYVSISDNAAFRVTSALSIAGWINATSWPSGTFVSGLLRKGDSNPNNWQLSVADGRVEMLLDGNDDSGFQGSSVLATGQWVHIAGTWDGTTVRLYVNGVLNASASKAAPIATDTRTIYLGGRIGSTDVTNGVVDDVRFYNRPLTAAEIADLAKAAPRIISWKQVAPQ